MAKFFFRLESVRRYRATLESAAKDGYRDAQRRTIDCEQDIFLLKQKIGLALQDPVLNIVDRLTLDDRIDRIESHAREQEIVLLVLQQEEQTALENWVEAKRELEILEKLREKRREEWALDEVRKEQAALDEWAVTRRKPA